MKKVTIGIIIGLLIGISGSALAVTTGLVKQYPDVDYNDYYAPHLNAMTLAGVVNGYTNGNFGPGDSVTRAQAVTMLDQYAEKVVAAKINAKLDAILPMFKGLSLNPVRVSYQDATQLANAGLYKLNQAPDLKDYTKKTDASLAEGWEVYVQSNPDQDVPTSYYLHFTGQKQGWASVPEGWYGLFYEGIGAAQIY